MRISDWSSDVCSSDLLRRLPGWLQAGPGAVVPAGRGATGVGPARGLFFRPRRSTRPGRPGRHATRALSRADRKRAVQGKSVSGRVDLAGRRILKIQTHKYISTPRYTLTRHHTQ